MIYLALSTAPRTAPTGEVTITKAGEEIKWHKVTGWTERGLIEARTDEQALAEAKRRWGGSPVLVPMDESIH